MRAGRVFLLFFLLSGSAAVSSFAQTNIHWEFAGWYGGGCYPNVEFDPNVKGRVYLVSDVAGLWRSDDTGENWRFINKGLRNLIVAFIAVAPSDSNVLYAGTKDGLFRSKDAGESWGACAMAHGRVSFIRPENYRSLAVAGFDPAKIVAGTASGALFYSRDFGDHWSILGFRERPFQVRDPITAVAWSSNNESIMVSSKKGMATYSFKDDQWRIFENGPEDVTDFFVSGLSGRLYVAGQRALYFSDDGGHSWDHSKPIPTGNIYRLAVVESQPSRQIYVGWNRGWSGGVLVSLDEGDSWKNLDKNFSPDVFSNPTRVWAAPKGRINSLKADPFHKGILFRTDWWGVWRSDDGGANWSEKIKGAPNTAGSDIFVSKQGEVYVATMDDGLLKSSDAGKSYMPLFPSGGFNRQINGHVWRVITLDQNKVRATSSPWDDKVNQVIASDNGGRSFVVIRSGLPKKRPKKNTMWNEGYPRAFAVDPKAPHILYLGIDGDDGGGLFISKDTGWHWERSKGQPASLRIYNALAVDPTNTARIFWGAYGKRGGIYLSENTGASWKRVFYKMRKVFDIAVAKDGGIYAAGDQHGACLYYSQNHGDTWRLLKKFSLEGTVEGICLIPGNGKVIAVSTVEWNGTSGGKIYLSRDGGEHWLDITGDLPPGTGAAAIAYNPLDSSLYITRYAGSVYKAKFE